MALNNSEVLVSCEIKFNVGLHKLNNGHGLYVSVHSKAGGWEEVSATIGLICITDPNDL